MGLGELAVEEFVGEIVVECGDAVEFEDFGDAEYGWTERLRAEETGREVVRKFFEG